MINPDFNQRLQSFQNKLVQSGVDAALISKKTSILYFTGYKSLEPTEREAYLFVTPKKVVLYHTPFIPFSNINKTNVQAVAMSAKNSMRHILETFLGNVQVIGIEKLDLTVAESERSWEVVNPATITSIDKLITDQRLIKDEHELIQLKKSCQIAIKTFKWISDFIHSSSTIGISEIDLTNAINTQLKIFGAECSAFPTIVAFDAHSASPHHVPTTKKMKKSSIVLVDMGAQYHSYKSDMTRTWCLSANPSPLFSKVEKIVRNAFNTAGSKANLHHQNQTTAADLDYAARSVIDSSGFGSKFIHTTGHGIGLETHEAPSLNHTNQTVLQPHMAITIEPGIYLEGKFGYRHEDTFLLTT